MIAYHSVRIDTLKNPLEILNLLLKNMLILSLGDAVAEIEKMFRQSP